MNKDESTFFRVIDKYARQKHLCFLSEMFPNEQCNWYFLCFRPLETKLSEDRYVCVYIEVELSEIRLVAVLKTLPESLYVPLDEKLTKLRQEQ